MGAVDAMVVSLLIFNKSGQYILFGFSVAEGIEDGGEIGVFDVELYEIGDIGLISFVIDSGFIGLIVEKYG